MRKIFLTAILTIALCGSALASNVIPPTGPAGTPNSNVLSVQGISGGTTLHTTIDSGAVTVSGTATVSQATGSNLHVVVDTAPTTATYTRCLTRLTDYQGGTNPVYIGEATPGSALSSASWRIEFINYDVNGNQISVQWSTNYSNFGDIWNNRTSLSYS